MPIADSQFTDSDLILGLYNDPTNVQLLDDYNLVTGGIQTGQIPANLYASNPVITPPDPNEPPCFAGETLVTLFNAVQIPFEELYENRSQYIGKGTAAFTVDNILVPGEIREVYKTKVYELLHVRFENEDGVMRMRKEHQFWLKSRQFRPMHEIRRNQPLWAYENGWQLTKVVDREVVQYPDGVFVYNMLVGIYHDYFATHPEGKRAKAVSNAKLIPGQNP
jgi:hypothetical protein